MVAFRVLGHVEVFRAVNTKLVLFSVYVLLEFSALHLHIFFVQIFKNSWVVIFLLLCFLLHLGLLLIISLCCLGDPTFSLIVFIRLI